MTEEKGPLIVYTILPYVQYKCFLKAFYLIKKHSEYMNYDLICFTEQEGEKTEGKAEAKYRRWHRGN